MLLPPDLLLRSACAGVRGLFRFVHWIETYRHCERAAYVAEATSAKWASEAISTFRGGLRLLRGSAPRNDGTAGPQNCAGTLNLI